MSHESPTSQTLFSIDPGSSRASGDAYRQVTAQAAGLKEGWFRDAIAANPELVISACRRAGLTDEQWFLWDIEVGVTDGEGRAIGSIDVLLLSETGRVGVVETKLSYNPEQRRSVVAQVLDYALNLQDNELEVLPALPSGGVDSEDVRHRLRDGDFLLIVAGDVLDPRAVRLGQTMLGAHVFQRWELAMVDMSLYRKAEDSPGPEWIMVPTLRGTLLAETRQVFEIRVSGLPEGTRTTVQAVTPEPEPRASGRAKWDRTSFLAALESASVPSEFRRLGSSLLDLAVHYPELSVRYGTSRDGSIVLCRNGYGILEYFLGGSGTLSCRPDKIVKALPAQVGDAYQEGLRRLFGPSVLEPYSKVPANQVATKVDELLVLLKETLAGTVPVA